MRKIKTKDGRVYFGTSSQFTDMADHILFKKYGRKHRIYKVNIASDEEDCFVATVVYGDFDAPEVLALRYFRDRYLLRSVVGRAFVKAYYAWGSNMAIHVINLLGQPGRAVLQAFLAPLVRKMQHGLNKENS